MTFAVITELLPPRPYLNKGIYDVLLSCEADLNLDSSIGSVSYWPIADLD